MANWCQVKDFWGDSRDIHVSNIATWFLNDTEYGDWVLKIFYSGGYCQEFPTDMPCRDVVDKALGTTRKEVSREKALRRIREKFGYIIESEDNGS